MQRIPFTPSHTLPLHSTASTRTLEARGHAAAGPHVLMQRAGAAIARLAMALAPHAPRIWLACGPGNNGGDGLEAATLLHKTGRQVLVSWLGSPDNAPADALLSWRRAVQAGVPFMEHPPADLGPRDLCIDALLGIGLTQREPARRPPAPLLELLHVLRECTGTVLCVDVPSGLKADTGQWAPGFARHGFNHQAGERHTLSLLTLKPGLFTGIGRDEAGHVWLDDLGVHARDVSPDAWLAATPAPAHRPHASHKGSWGDVAVIGGEGLRERGMGMTGAAWLAASAALHAGAGRVMFAPLDKDLLQAPATQPEIMLRHFDRLELESITTVCGCGGGEAIRRVLPEVLARAHRLVLDADALNALATDTALQALMRDRAAARRITVMTPHPLEAARLLGTSTQAVQADRLACAQALAELYACIVNLKGSGSVIAAPVRTPCINTTGNARLATGGTGDVLAGLLGAHLAALPADGPDLIGQAVEATMKACWQHGHVADAWSCTRPLTASLLASALTPL